MKKVILALVTVGSLAVAAQAFQDWTGQYGAWTWNPKNGQTVPVKMKIVRWADITYCPDQPQEIVLIETDSDGVGTYEGCVCLKACVNFAGLNVKAEYVHDDNAIKFKDGGKKYVSLVAAGDPRSYNEGSTTYTVTSVHLSGSEKPLDLCVKLTNVDILSNWTVGDAPPIPVGEVKLTMWPSGAP